MSEDGDKKPNGCAQGCGGLIMLFIAFAVFGAIFGDGDSNDSSTASSRTITMKGEITVYDQATCSSGPMVKVHAGGRLQSPVTFRDSNAPCNLTFTIDVTEGASSYKVQVDNLPARIFSPDDMLTSGGNYEVKMTVYGD